MAQNSIPGHPGIGAAQAAAGGTAPVQVHQGAPAGIPGHPGIAQMHVQQQGVPLPKDDQVDFFARTAVGDDEVEDLTGFPASRTPEPVSQPSTDLINTDELLGGGQFPQEAPVVQQQQAPQGQPTQQGAPQPQPVQQQGQPQSQGAPQVEQSPEQLQSAAIDYLKGSVYHFDDATARQALTEPEVVLPQLAARLHLNLVQEFAQQIHRVVPMLVERAVVARTASLEAQNEFFRRFPRLNKPEYMPIIEDSLRMARQMYPNADRNQLMNEGAALSAYRIRGQAPRAPAASQRPVPFQPANPGGGGMHVPTNPGQATNPFAELAMDPHLLDFD